MTESADNALPVPAVRVGDPERALAARQLQVAVGEGRLDLIELDRRLAQVYAARTKDELVAVTADLPGMAAPPIELRTKSGSRDKRGRWVVPTSITLECGSGDIHLDFTEAVCVHQEVNPHVAIGSGSLELVLPYGWGIDFDQVTVDSGHMTSKLRVPHLTGAPLLRFDGRVKSGYIEARNPRRNFWTWLRRRPY
ncbi:DUF1707 domain-containing protein [Nocardia sp. XZ_19_385]|uniref:DUF1707 SHOCT-like domain-containing protein n=1 Tax=Nocardia sp. XZ_19_385 TaxID=2769488 RepID=UPI00189093F3|nr:DUF1707 domain-containing protein [Nocardia sp. XZ_19_385]